MTLQRRGRSEAAGKAHTGAPSLDPQRAKLEGIRSGEILRVGDSIYSTAGRLPEHTLLLKLQVCDRGAYPGECPKLNFGLRHANWVVDFRAFVWLYHLVSWARQALGDSTHYRARGRRGSQG